LVGFLDPVPRVARLPHVIGGKKIGVLHVEKHERQPVIALKEMGSDLREGAIYFRYVGETRQIKPGELRAIIEMREARAVAEFSRRMSRVASGAGATIDLDTGEVSGRTGSFVIDRELLVDPIRAGGRFLADKGCACASAGRRCAADIACGQRKNPRCA